MRSKVREIEQREKAPLADVLTRLYAEHGNQKDVAEALKVSPSWVSIWVARLQLEEKTIVVPKRQEKSAQPCTETLTT